MKKNFKTLMSSTFAALSVMFALGTTTSCQDEYGVNENESDSNALEAQSSADDIVLKDGLNVYPLLYNMYLSDYDVQITSADTTTMSISAALLGRQNIDLKDGDVISVWKDKAELPFMRQITSVQSDGNAVNVTTRDIQASELIQDGQLEFDSKVCVDPSVSATNSNGSINSLHFKSKQDDCYHPVAIFMHSEAEDQAMESKCGSGEMENANSYSRFKDADPYATNSKAQFGQTQKGDKRVYVVSELENSNFDFGISVSGKVENICFPIVSNDKDTLANFGIEEASAAISGGLHASLNISWFKVKKFEIGPYYSIEANIKPTLNASVDFIDWEKEYTVMKCQGYTCVFWVGPIPVSISFKPAITLGLEAKGTISGSVGFEYTCSGSGHTYAVYENGGWHTDKGGKEFTHEFNPIFGGSISASAQAGLYLKGDVMLYGVAGPTLKVGPVLKAEAEASLNLADDIAAEASLTCGLEATIGAKLEIWKWNLAQWSTTISLFKKELWKRSWSLKEWIEASKQVAEQTGNMTEDMAKIIKDEQDDKYIEKFDESSLHKRFIKYMTLVDSEKQRELKDLARKNDIAEEWQEIAKNPTTFYDWEMEYLIWYGTRNEPTLLNIAMGRIVEDNLSKVEFCNNYRLNVNVLKIHMTNYIFGQDEAISKMGASSCMALVKDLENMRAEYRRYKNDRKYLSAADIENMFVKPWIEKFYQK